MLIRLMGRLPSASKEYTTLSLAARANPGAASTAAAMQHAWVCFNENMDFMTFSGTVFALSARLIPRF
jgi:hypothetical protein